MILAYGSQKGGVGKSTGATNAAAERASNGARVLLIEGDPKNASSKTFIAERLLGDNLTKIDFIEKRGAALKKAIETLSASYDDIIVDLAGRESKDLRYAMQVADAIIVPCKHSQVDIDTLGVIDEAFRESRAFNPKLKLLLYFSMARTRSAAKLFDARKIVRNDYPDFTVLKSVVYDRAIYEDLIAYGLGVADDNTQATKLARAEIKALVKEIGTHVGEKTSTIKSRSAKTPRKSKSTKKSKPKSKPKGETIR